MNLLKIMVWLIGCFAFSFAANAQTDSASKKSENPLYYQNLKKEENRIAAQHASRLREGVLVVRLQTFDSKINTLKRYIEEEPNRKRLKKQLSRTLENKYLLQEATVKAYLEHFSYTKDIVFMPDTAAKSFLKGIRKGIFLNPETLQMDETIEIDENRFVYLTYIGTPPISISNGKESLLIANANNILLSPPFPYATPLYTFIESIAFISDAQAINSAVKQQQKRLDKFLEKRLPNTKFD